MSSAPEYRQEYVDRGGDRIGLQIYPDPEGVTGAPVAVICPAMGVPARYYRPFAADLRAAGLAVAVADLRGTGASTPLPSRASGYGYAELVADVGAVLDALKPHRDGRPTLLLGHSLGGQAAALHLALTGDATVDGLALVASGVPYWRAFPGAIRYGILPYTQGIAATAALLRVWPGWGFGGRQARGVIRDWAYAARTGRFPLIDGIDPQAALRAVTTPVLALSVDGDRYTPHETLDYLCAKLAGAPVRRERHRPDSPVDHFTWVRSGAPIAARIAAFAADLRTPAH
ncbi:alpha/beta hydrolase family protein [Micromonospora pattaloongensis]|uniref:alpha/beta hydrolase family protein n=1 Tax=Micromonospora pattaloongensis TaxID=405436 RepID=UPI001FE0359E|nr:alpha/beta fold hydrolase [Micromonospora pattaloongensis]